MKKKFTVPAKRALRTMSQEELQKVYHELELQKEVYSEEARSLIYSREKAHNYTMITKINRTLEYIEELIDKELYK